MTYCADCELLERSLSDTLKHAGSTRPEVAEAFEAYVRHLELHEGLTPFVPLRNSEESAQAQRA
jgi:hypothetical protein